FAVGAVAGRALVAVDGAAGDNRRIVLGGGRHLVVLARQRLEIGGDGVEIGGIEVRGTVYDLLRHQAGGGGAGVVAGLEEVRDVGARPTAEPVHAVIGNVGRKPALQDPALQEFAVFVAA